MQGRVPEAWWVWVRCWACRWWPGRPSGPWWGSWCRPSPGPGGPASRDRAGTDRTRPPRPGTAAHLGYAPRLHRREVAVFRIRIHFFTDPDPGFFPQSGSGSRQQKTTFFKAKPKFWEKFFLSTQKVRILFLFSTNQVPVPRYFIKHRT